MKKKCAGMIILLILIIDAMPIKATASNSYNPVALLTEMIDNTNEVLPTEMEGIVNELYQELMGFVFDVNTGLYKEYYGGAYIDERYVLNIQMVEGFESEKYEIMDVVGNNNVIFNTVSTSLNELLSARNEIVNLIAQSNTNKTIEISDTVQYYKCINYVSVSEKNNTIVVGLNDMTEDLVKQLYSLFGKESIIQFEKSYYPVTTTSAWNPGRAIFRSTGEQMSTGYRCYLLDSNGTRYNGFVTAGHGISNLQYLYTSNNVTTLLGVCKVSQFSDDTDAAFISIIGTNYAPSNTMHYSSSAGHLNGITVSADDYVVSVAEGTTIYKCGSVSYRTSGTVLSNSCTVNYSDTWISDVINATVLNLPGDSGGCAYIYTGGKYVVVGSMSGSQFSSSNEKNSSTFISSYISKIDNARTSLGIRKY